MEKRLEEQIRERIIEVVAGGIARFCLAGADLARLGEIKMIIDLRLPEQFDRPGASVMRTSVLTLSDADIQAAWDLSRAADADSNLNQLLAG